MAPHGPDKKPILYIWHKWLSTFLPLHTFCSPTPPPPHVCTKGILKEINPELFIGRTDAEVESLILWLPDAKSWFIGKRPRCWERLRLGGEVGDRGWDDWMASLTLWTWVWANCEKYWRQEKPGVQQSMGSQSQTQLRNWTRMPIPLILSHPILACGSENLLSSSQTPLLSLKLDSPFIFLLPFQSVFFKIKSVSLNYQIMLTIAL